MNPDGSSPVNLTNNAANDSQAAWSPDGLKIAFTSNRNGTNDIWVMNANGSNPVRLTKSSFSESQPNYNNTGSKIAFTSDKAGNLDVWSVKPSGKGSKNLTPASLADDSDPAYSPDGTRIAFTSTRDGNNEVYVMGASGGGQTNFTGKAESDSQPTWAPDHGGRILFTSNRKQANDEVFYMRGFNGADPFGLTVLPSAQDSEPSWQPLPPYAPSGSPIEHIVFLIQENHSFDNVLGHLCVEDARCDGQITGELSDGTIIDLPPADDMIPKSPHSYDSHIIAMNGGQMNGYDLLGPDCEGPAYRCHQAYEPEQIPNLAALARQFTIADHSFETDGTAARTAPTSPSPRAGWTASTRPRTTRRTACRTARASAVTATRWGSGTRTTRRSPGPSPRASPPGRPGPSSPRRVQLSPLDHGAPRRQNHSWRIYGEPFIGTETKTKVIDSRVSRMTVQTGKETKIHRTGSAIHRAAAGNLPDFSFVIPDNDPSHTTRGR